MSAVSRLGFLRSGLTLAVLTYAGTRPELREELMREVRNGRMSAGGPWLDLTSLTLTLTSSGERGVKQVRPTEVGLVGGRIALGVKEELMAFTFLVK